MQTNIKIIFPPQFEPFQPYLSLPYLKALLKIYGYNSTCFDANLDFYWWIFTKLNAEKSTIDERTRYLINNISKALEIIRSIPEKFTDYKWAINVMDEYLSALSPPNINISLNSLSIGNKYASDNLYDYVKNENNIFKTYFIDSEKIFLNNPKADIYFFSIVVPDQLPAALTFANEIKLRQPESIIVAGGPLISHIYHRLISLPWIKDLFDIITPKEGNLAIKDIFKLSNCYEGHVTPDFCDLQLDRYFSPQIVFPYLIAHGCRWGRCSFCSHHLSYRQFRESNINDVISDISLLQKKYGAKYISFSDEYLTPYQLEQISNHILSNSLEIKWSTFVRAEPKFTDNAFANKLYDAGCRLLMFGFESASQQILNSMNKGTQSRYYPAILRSCKNAKIALRLDFMLGFPNESEKDIQKTFFFIKKNIDLIDTPFSSFSVSVFELRKGTPISKDLDQYKIKLISPLRGDLDNQFEFIDKSGISSQKKKEWREIIISYFKNDFNNDFISPHNKTHQLIMKDLYDEGCFELPISIILPSNMLKLKAGWSPGVNIDYGYKNIRVRNLSTGGELVISNKLVKIINALSEIANLGLLFQNQTLLNKSTYVSFMNFLLRNEYIYVCYDEHKNVSLAVDVNKDIFIRPAL